MLSFGVNSEWLIHGYNVVQKLWFYQKKTQTKLVTMRVHAWKPPLSRYHNFSLEIPTASVLPSRLSRTLRNQFV